MQVLEVEAILRQDKTRINIEINCLALGKYLHMLGKEAESLVWGEAANAIFFDRRPSDFQDTQLVTSVVENFRSNCTEISMQTLRACIDNIDAWPISSEV